VVLILKFIDGGLTPALSGQEKSPPISRKGFILIWWAPSGSNREPRDYEFRRPLVTHCCKYSYTHPRPLQMPYDAYKSLTHPGNFPAIHNGCHLKSLTEKNNQKASIGHLSIPRFSILTGRLSGHNAFVDSM